VLTNLELLTRLGKLPGASASADSDIQSLWTLNAASTSALVGAYTMQSSSQPGNTISGNTSTQGHAIIGKNVSAGRDVIFGTSGAAGALLANMSLLTKNAQAYLRRIRLTSAGALCS